MALGTFRGCMGSGAEASQRHNRKSDDDELPACQDRWTGQGRFDHRFLRLPNMWYLCHHVLAPAVLGSFFSTTEGDLWCVPWIVYPDICD